MNGSLPPISRFMRATRCEQAAATALPVSTEPVKATPPTRSSSTSAANVAGARQQAHRPGGSSAKQSASMSVDSGVSSEGFATTVLPAASAGRASRRAAAAVVPWDDAAPDADGLLHNERELGGLDRRITRPAKLRPISA